MRNSHGRQPRQEATSQPPTVIRPVRPRLRFGFIAAVAVLVVGVSIPASAAPNPAHNVTVNRLISNTPGQQSTACSVQYQHGNLWTVSYAKIRRGFAHPEWLPTTTSSYAANGYRYRWGASYPNLPDGNTVRCAGTDVTLTYLFGGQLLNITTGGTGVGWHQATGPQWSSIVGGRGWVSGNTNPAGGQPLASRDFPGV